jgi:hypothetical protein
LGTRGLRGVTTQAFEYSYIYMLKYILQPFWGAKEKGKWKGDGADDPKPWA